MRRTRAAIGAIAFFLSQIPLQSGPMATVRILIKGEQLLRPVEITDPQVLALFRAGAGPGNFELLPGGVRQPIYAAQSFVVDWSRGIVKPPEGLQVYDVSFVTTHTHRNIYFVRYGVDRSTSEGYVYIPGKTDAAYEDNTWIILRGVEGNWFHAWSVWEKVANPLISDARKVH